MFRCFLNLQNDSLKGEQQNVNVVGFWNKNGMEIW